MSICSYGPLKLSNQVDFVVQESEIDELKEDLKELKMKLAENEVVEKERQKSIENFDNDTEDMRRHHEEAQRAMKKVVEDVAKMNAKLEEIGKHRNQILRKYEKLAKTVEELEVDLQSQIDQALNHCPRINKTKPIKTLKAKIKGLVKSKRAGEVCAKTCPMSHVFAHCQFSVFCFVLHTIVGALSRNPG